MDLDDFDLADLRTHMLLAMDFVTAHRVARAHKCDISQIAAMRAVLEERVLRALSKNDTSQIPFDWS